MVKVGKMIWNLMVGELQPGNEERIEFHRINLRTRDDALCTRHVHSAAVAEGYRAGPVALIRLSHRHKLLLATVERAHFPPRLQTRF
jgi:hypothetical protein